MFWGENISFRKGIVLLLMAEILHQLIGSLSHYLQGFNHPMWCRISSINSSSHSVMLKVPSCNQIPPISRFFRAFSAMVFSGPTSKTTPEPKKKQPFPVGFVFWLSPKPCGLELFTPQKHVLKKETTHTHTQKKKGAFLCFFLVH